MAGDKNFWSLFGSIHHEVDDNIIKQDRSKAPLKNYLVWIYA